MSQVFLFFLVCISPAFSCLFCSFGDDIPGMEGLGTGKCHAIGLECSFNENIAQDGHVALLNPDYILMAT